MDIDSAARLIEHAVSSGHAANGYLIVGDLANGRLLVDRLLAFLFPSVADPLSNPDVAWLEPEGKKRIIRISSMRDQIVAPMAQTSFSGGWKVGVIIGADRMEAPSANAFLKSLEEPTKQTLYLLLTDAPDGLLPTIVSRTQRVDLPLSDGALSGADFDAIAEIFRSKKIAGVYEKAQAARRLTEIFAGVKEESDDPAQARKAFFRTIMSFVRVWMTEGSLAPYKAFRNVDAVEEAYTMSERALGDEAVLSFLTDRLFWPGEAK